MRYLWRPSGVSLATFLKVLEAEATSRRLALFPSPMLRPRRPRTTTTRSAGPGPPSDGKCTRSGGAVGALRMLRLVRLLTFIKGVPQLRVILSGLVQGMNSVTYIVMLLFLIMYLFSIMGCLFFGPNDMARFGTVAQAM